jgi:hypothetical protein
MGERWYVGRFRVLGVLHNLHYGFLLQKKKSLRFQIPGYVTGNDCNPSPKKKYIAITNSNSRLRHRTNNKLLFLLQKTNSRSRHRTNSKLLFLLQKTNPRLRHRTNNKLILLFLLQKTNSRIRHRQRGHPVREHSCDGLLPAVSGDSDVF